MYFTQDTHHPLSLVIGRVFETQTNKQTKQVVYINICISILQGGVDSRMPYLAGVPLSQSRPGFLITAHHLCAFLLYLEGCVASKHYKKISVSYFRKRAL